MNKMINGVSVPVSPQEEQQLKEEWDATAADQAKAAAELQKYDALRRAEYPSLSDLVEALIEKEEGDPTFLNSLVLKRLQVKNKYPKPKE